MDVESQNISSGSLKVLLENIKLCNNLQAFINILLNNLENRKKFIVVIEDLIKLDYNDYVFVNKVFTSTKLEFNHFFENINFLFSKSILSADESGIVKEIAEIKILLNNIIKQEFKNISDLFKRLDNLNKVTDIADTFNVLNNSLIYKLENISKDLYIYQTSLIDKFSELSVNKKDKELLDKNIVTDVLKYSDSENLTKQNIISIENGVNLLYTKLKAYQVLLNSIKTTIHDFFDNYKDVLSNKYYINDIQSLIDDAKSILYKIDSIKFFQEYISILNTKIIKLESVLAKEQEIKDSDIATIKNFESMVASVFENEDFIQIEQLDDKIVQLESLSRDLLSINLKYADINGIINKIDSKISMVNDFKYKKKVMNSSALKKEKSNTISNKIKIKFNKLADMF
jgi:hypothetical protein